MSLVIGRHYFKNQFVDVTSESKLEDFAGYFNQYPELKTIISNDNNNKGTRDGSKVKVESRQIKSKRPHNGSAK